MSYLLIPGVAQFINRAKPVPVPLVRTSYAIIVQERADGRLAILTKVTRHAERTIDTRQAFTVTEQLDPRLEHYLNLLARMERTRRKRASGVSPAQMGLGL